ncbi:unnamed protein product [Ectocarpus sp. CCAP 1310/34]|nr:unnamed protein product [Ectocarpus sp. CCAP 1310/34]
MKAFAEAGQKVVESMRSNSRENTTVVTTISANGVTWAPITIFKGQRLQPDWFAERNCPRDARYAGIRTPDLNLRRVRGDQQDHRVLITRVVDNTRRCSKHQMPGTKPRNDLLEVSPTRCVSAAAEERRVWRRVCVLAAAAAAARRGVWRRLSATAAAITGSGRLHQGCRWTVRGEVFVGEKGGGAAAGSSAAYLPVKAPANAASLNVNTHSATRSPQRPATSRVAPAVVRQRDELDLMEGGYSSRRVAEEHMHAWIASPSSLVAALAPGTQTDAAAMAAASVTGGTAAAAAAAASPVAALASGIRTTAAAAVATSIGDGGDGSGDSSSGVPGRRVGVGHPDDRSGGAATAAAASPVAALASGIRTTAAAAVATSIGDGGDGSGDSSSGVPGRRVGVGCPDGRKGGGGGGTGDEVLEERDSQCAGVDVSNSSSSSSSSSSCSSDDSGGDGSGDEGLDDIWTAAMGAGMRGWMKPGVEPHRTLSTPARHLRVARGDGGRYQVLRTPSIGAGTGVAAPAAATAAAVAATRVATSARAPAATPAAAGAATRVVASARAPTAAADGSGGLGQNLVGGSGDNGGGVKGGSSDVTGSRVGAGNHDSRGGEGTATAAMAAAAAAAAPSSRPRTGRTR